MKTQAKGEGNKDSCDSKQGQERLQMPGPHFQLVGCYERMPLECIINQQLGVSGLFF
jgi:hypothetical protein